MPEFNLAMYQIKNRVARVRQYGYALAVVRQAFYCALHGVAFGCVNIRLILALYTIHQFRYNPPVTSKKGVIGFSSLSQQCDESRTTASYAAFLVRAPV